MELFFNPRENGACPFCRKENDCLIRNRLISSVSEITAHSDDAFEVVIYRCPHYVAMEEQ